MDAKDEDFVNYPEPETTDDVTLSDTLSDWPVEDKAYIKALDNLISAVRKYVATRVQPDVGKKMSKFKEELPQNTEKTDLDALANHKGQIKVAMRKRKDYREIIKDAMDERQKFIDSILKTREEEERLRYKGKQLRLIDPTQKETREKAVFDIFAALFFAIQIVLVLAYVVCTRFRDDATPAEGNNGGSMRSDDYYTFYVQILLMVAFGYGSLLSFLKKYSFSAIGYNFLMTAYAMQLGILTQLLFKNIHNNPTDPFESLNITIPVLIDAAYVATACCISWAVIAGKVNILELAIITTFEVFFYSVNYWVVVLILGVVEPGGSTYIHMFGAYFGIGVTLFLSRPFRPTDLKHYLDELNSSTYYSEFFSLVGTIILFCFFPAFNAATAPNGSQHRVIVNTFVSISASVVFAFFTSRTIRRRHMNIRDIQNATLAGGIAMGNALSMVITPGPALLVGIVAGTVSVMGHALFQPWIEKKFPFPIFDTRGAHNTHGLAGIIGGIGTAIATGIAGEKAFGQSTMELFPHGLPKQGGYQAGAIFVSFIIGLSTGMLVGLVLFVARRFNPRLFKAPYQDEWEWNVPADYPKNYTETS